MAKGYRRNGWIMVVLLMVGLVIGGFLGELLGNYVPILKFGYPIEITPHTWSLSIVKLHFGFSMNINMFSILGIIAAILIYKEM